MKTLFIPSYYFPPYANVNIVRTAKHCKILPSLGWRILVLSVSPEYYKGCVVEKISKDVPHTNVVKIPFINIPKIDLIIKLLFPLIIVLFLIKNRKKIDAVYLSGSPFYPFPITFFCTKILGIPSILDFRDSWSINFGYDGIKAKHFFHSLRQRFYWVIEYIGIKFSSGVVFSTPILTEEYSRLFSKFKDKFHTIYNGFDEDDFESLSIDSTINNKTLIISGQFAVYTPELINYIFGYFKNNSDHRLIYVGSEHEFFKQMMHKYRLEQQVDVFQYLSYEKVLQLVSKSGYGLVSTGLKNGLGTKIFDYLALSKPILCFVPKGSMIGLEFGCLDHVVISEVPHTRESVERAIKKLIEIKQVEDIQTIRKYTRQEASKQLVKILDNCF